MTRRFTVLISIAIAGCLYWSRAGIWSWLVAVAGAPLSAEAVRAVLGSLGIVSSIVTFAIGSVVARPAMVRWRRVAWWVLVLWWAAVVLCLADVLQPLTVSGIPNVAVKIALVVWLAGLVRLLALTWQILFVQRSALEALSHRGVTPFDAPAPGELGVAFLDRWAQQLDQSRHHLNFPLLLAAEREARGLEVSRRFLVAGLHRGAGIVYLTFTRPAQTIVRQLASAIDRRRLSPLEFLRRVHIIDCYSPLYAQRDRLREVAYEGYSARVTQCDPRDPVAVQGAYTRALGKLHKSDVRSARAVYDSLTDFVSIADADLVVSYLRRMVVFEEELRVQALYLLWPDVLSAPVSDQYLSWFFSSVLSLRNEGGEITAALENMPEIHGRVRLDAGLDLADRGVEIDRDRISSLAEAARALGYKAVPMDDPVLFPQWNSRKLEAEFFFYLTAIDHRTTRQGGRFEAEIGGRRRHGSDLMYARANAKADLFNTEGLRAVTEADITAVFRNDDGTTIDAPGLRAWLLRQAAEVVTDAYGGDIMALLAACEQRLETPDRNGLLQRLPAFRAYEDPLRKKSHLLTKILMRRGLFAPLDPERQEVPVDPVLVHAALRSGLVRVTDETLVATLRSGGRLSEEQAGRVRFVTLRAFHEVAERSAVPAYELDDLLWGFGRELARLSPDAAPQTLAQGPSAAGVQNKTALVPFLNLLAGRETGGSVTPAPSSALMGLAAQPVFPDTWYY